MFDWKKALATVAPALATAVGGPAAGLAARAITTALGLADGADEDEISDAIRNDPEALLKLKQAEYEFKLKCKEIGLELDKLRFSDTQGARQREIALKDRTPAVLSGFLVIGFFVILVSLFIFDIPDGAKEILYIMIGALSTNFGQIYNYYFGSSKGSSDKNKIMASQLD
ncbi:hypothetical protein LCGC14_1833850 [marine sediment metagenome]|uniref:TMhelix containing protein n=1 Tax=marine sediment metagenome TaxID=412755 RepID=A0A0F9GF83_9ZZZZ